jgi:hypothetical protein
MKKVVSFICIVFLLMSCEKPIFDNVANSELSFSNARAWFEEQGSFYGKNHRINGDENNPKRSTDWDSGKKGKNHKGEDMLIYPIMYDTQYALPALSVDNNDQNSKNIKINKDNIIDEASVQEFLTIYKDNKGNNQARIVQLLPDKKYRNKFKKKDKYDDFSGYIFVRTLDEIIDIGFQYEDGKLLRTLKTTQPKNGKTDELFCEVTTTTYYYSVSIAGVIYSWGVIRTESSLYCYWATSGDSATGVGSGYPSNYGSNNSSAVSWDGYGDGPGTYYIPKPKDPYQMNQLFQKFCTNEGNWHDLKDRILREARADGGTGFAYKLQDNPDIGWDKSNSIILFRPTSGEYQGKVLVHPRGKTTSDYCR